MLKIFESIFGGKEEKGRYPESLIEMAIERAIDGTDARLCALSGYRKRLREPVIHAIDHVIALVASLPEPLSANAADYSSDPRVKALFVSPDHLREVLGNDPVLAQYRDAHPAAGGTPVFALLLAERREKQVFGSEMAGDIVRRDVAQVTVSFGQHRTVDPADSEAEVRRQLRHRAFDYLISLALGHITGIRNERLELGHQRELLKRKLATLQKGGWSFDDRVGEQHDPLALQAELETIEQELAGLRAEDGALNGQLEIIADILGHAEQHFWIAGIALHIDRMNIKRDATDSSAETIAFQELGNAHGFTLVATLVSLRLDDLPQRKSFAENAARCLAELGGVR